MKWLDKLHAKSGWTDLIAITGILLAVNLVYAPRDVGWLKLNPSPWLFLPLSLIHI